MRVKQKRRPKTKEQRKKESIRKYERYHETLKFDPEYKAKASSSTRRWQATCPEKCILSSVKSKSKKYNLPFNLELKDIQIPEYCPVFGIKLVTRRTIGTLTSKDNSASIDRKIPELGYIKGNIQIISAKANQMKHNASPEELIKFAKWILNSE